MMNREEDIPRGPGGLPIGDQEFDVEIDVVYRFRSRVTHSELVLIEGGMNIFGLAMLRGLDYSDDGKLMVDKDTLESLRRDSVSITGDGIMAIMTKLRDEQTLGMTLHSVRSVPRS